MSATQTTADALKIVLTLLVLIIVLVEVDILSQATLELAII